MASPKLLLVVSDCHLESLLEFNHSEQQGFNLRNSRRIAVSIRVRVTPNPRTCGPHELYRSSYELDCATSPQRRARRAAEEDLRRGCTTQERSIRSPVSRGAAPRDRCATAAHDGRARILHRGNRSLSWVRTSGRRPARVRRRSRVAVRWVVWTTRWTTRSAARAAPRTSILAAHV